MIVYDKSIMKNVVYNGLHVFFQGRPHETFIFTAKDIKKMMWIMITSKRGKKGKK